ncbi:MAG: hypothetical protein ACPHIA_04970 [Alphaproteobacteria bacterium]
MSRETGNWRDARATEALPVLVVFSDQTDLPWLHILKRGYRHCFLAIFQGSRWLIYDPLVHRTEIAALDLPSDFNLADWYQQHGLRVVATETLPAPVMPSPFAFWAYLPLRPFTCVEAVKRVLGIRAAGVFTPWQLYRYLHQFAKRGTVFPCLSS